MAASSVVVAGPPGIKQEDLHHPSLEQLPGPHNVSTTIPDGVCVSRSSSFYRDWQFLSLAPPQIIADSRLVDDVPDDNTMTVALLMIATT